VRTILQETPGPVELASLTVEQYEAMIEQGILRSGEPIELLDGLLVRKDRARSGCDVMTIGPEHQLVVNKLLRLVSRFERHACYLSVQGPIRIPPANEPEPDGAVIAGAPEDYATQHPGPREVYCVIEVADSSLLRDKTTKLRIYAQAGIKQYLIIDLVHRQLEVHEQPSAKEGRFKRSSVVAAGQTVAIAVGPSASVKIKAKDLLP
jgi:Uma2 family endonuclease